MAKFISLLCRSAEQTNDTMNGMLIQTDKQTNDTMNGLLMPQNKQALYR